LLLAADPVAWAAARKVAWEQLDPLIELN